MEFIKKKKKSNKMYQSPNFRGNNRILPSVILPSNNFFQGNNRQNAFFTQRYNYETTNTNVQPVSHSLSNIYKTFIEKDIFLVIMNE